MAAMPSHRAERESARGRSQEHGPGASQGHALGHSHASHGHAHAHGDEPELDIAPGPRLAVVGILVAVLVAVVVGVVALWPEHDKVQELNDSMPFAAEGVTFPHATVQGVEECPADEVGSRTCGILRVQVDDGPETDVHVSPDVAQSGLAAGDRVQLQRQPAPEGGEAAYAFYKADRGTSLWLLTGLFVVVVLAVARWRGLLALVGLGFGGLVIAGWLLPSLLSGHSPLLVGLVGSAAILYVVLYLAHGVSMRTSAALLGTLGGLVITAVLGLVSVNMTRLSGVADEGSGLLSQSATDLSFSALMICTIVIAGLGVLNDVTITQASAVWELRAASPHMPRWRLWTSAMRIGRDHIASTIYTIVFAYAGTALMTMLVIQLYDRPVLELVGTEQIAEEVVRSLVSSVGLVLAVPLTTVLAALTVPGPEYDPEYDRDY